MRKLVSVLVMTVLALAATACHEDRPTNSPLSPDREVADAPDVRSGLTSVQIEASDRSQLSESLRIPRELPEKARKDLLLSRQLAAPGTEEVITFDEFPASNNNSATLSDEYEDRGVIFHTDDGVIWGGLSNGDPGNWSLEGTNGPQFLGFNGPSYAAELEFSPGITELSIDVSRSLGSSPGDRFRLAAYCGDTVVDIDSLAFGAINEWQTASVSASCIESVVMSGTGSGFHPYGADNLRFDPMSAISVDIDIKPGSDTNPVNTRGRGKVPVAILTDSEFDAPARVDRSTLTFGATGDENSLTDRGKPCSVDDVDSDGDSDLICRFDVQDTGFQRSDSEGILRGATKSGTPIEGRDDVTIR